MAALFPRWSNTAMRIALLSLLTLIIGTPVGLMVLMRTPYITGEYRIYNQPVQFDHRHHVRDDGIRCLYCHSGADKSPYAGVPSTNVCMGCHTQILNKSPLLEPVRRSYFSGQPIPWQQVHHLPEFVYFNHAVHVKAGIGCIYCHGRVDLMARTYQVKPLQMGWCLNCHRAPQEVLHPDQYDPSLPSLWGDPAKMAKIRTPKKNKYAITRLTTCTACHR